MVNKVGISLPKTLRCGLFSYNLSFSKEKIYIFYLLNLKYFSKSVYKALLLWRWILSKNGHNHWALLIVVLKWSFAIWRPMQMSISLNTNITWVISTECSSGTYVIKILWCHLKCKFLLFLKLFALFIKFML